jgi:hypothetical protein
MGTLKGFPNPPALWLRRAKPASAYAMDPENRRPPPALSPPHLRSGPLFLASVASSVLCVLL